MTELKHCPFCGATRGLYALDVDNSTSGEPQVFCDNCKAVFECERASTIEEAIEAWNTRAEKTCKIKPWRMEEDTGFYDCLECECGHVMDGSEWAKSTYCPNCRARIVGD